MKRFIISLLALSVLLASSLAFAERSVTVKSKKSTNAAAVKVFKTNYYALVIGNNEYRQLPKLKTAVNDAKEVSRVLSERYGFKTKLLQNATRKDILNAVNEYRKSLTEKDSFLIYYAGHGEYDRTAEKGYWLPVDAEKDNPTDWIMAEDITSNIKRVAAKHVLVIADSCYSGTLDRSATSDLRQKGDRSQFLAKMMERPSRTLMASGGNEPVADAGGWGNHSVFASAFLTALKEAERNAFTAEELFHGRVKAIVAGRSEQVPQYSGLRNSGHEGGDFIFQSAHAAVEEEEISTDAGSHETIAPTLAKATPPQSSFNNPEQQKIASITAHDLQGTWVATWDHGNKSNPEITITATGQNTFTGIYKPPFNGKFEGRIDGSAIIIRSLRSDGSLYGTYTFNDNSFSSLRGSLVDYVTTYNNVVWRKR